MRVKTETRRQAILDIARKAFIEQGFEQTSMSAIAKKLGGSKATLYNYFNSKEDIFLAVMKSSTMEQISGAFHNLSVKKDIKAGLIEFGFIYLKSIFTPELLAIHKMAWIEADRSDVGRFFYEYGPKTGWNKVADYLQHQINVGMLPPCDPHLASLQMKALLEAELRDPYELGVIGQPQDSEIQSVVKRAIESFLMIYRPISHRSKSMNPKSSKFC